MSLIVKIKSWHPIHRRLTGDPVAVAFSLVAALINGEIVFDAKSTKTNIVPHSCNLCHWHEFLRLKPQQAGTNTLTF